MSIDDDIRLIRIKEGRCTSCGKMLEEGATYKQCIFCREYNRKRYYKSGKRRTPKSEAAKETDIENEYLVEWAKKARKEQESPGFSERAQRCMDCEWGKFTGTSVFCPSADGTCMKKQIARPCVRAADGEGGAENDT